MPTLMFKVKHTAVFIGFFADLVSAFVGLSMNGNQGRSQSFRKYLSHLTAIACLFLTPYNALTENLGDLARARFSTKSSTGTLSRVEYSGLNLTGGSELTVVAPRGLRKDASMLMNTLEETHQKYTALFGEIPKISLTVRLMDEETFYISTGAPRWTNAMFFKGQIVIPISSNAPIDRDNLFRSIRHEYTHAVVHALSSGACPGWLDEGLAQWAEGDVNPLLTQALSDWMVENKPVPFSLLQGGFTKLPNPMVPPAYAQSLLATKYLLQRYGIVSFTKLFKALREGANKSAAFKIAFGINEKQFEKEFSSSLPGMLSIRHAAHSSKSEIKL